MPQKRPTARNRPTASQRTGVLGGTELRSRVLLPGSERLRKGPVVIVECVENIPCDPCAHACPRKAITIAGALTDTPRVDFTKCNGCALCVARCPGLAVFVVHRNHTRTEAAVTMPYELLPRPMKGDTVDLLNRSGTKVGRGRVTRVLDTPAHDRCAVVTVTVPKRLWNAVRHIRLLAARRRT